MRRFKPKLQSYLCNVLHDHRRQSGLTQEKMADSLYMTVRSYGDLERGKSGFSAVSLMLLLAVLPGEEALHVIRDFASKLPEYEEEELS